MTDPELPTTLARLGENLDAAFAREERERSRKRRRRTILALTLLATGAPAAVATRPLWDGDTDAGRPVRALILAEGGAGSELWRLSSFQSDERLCLRFTIRTFGLPPVANCFTRWTGETVDFFTTSSASRSYVVGRTNEAVAMVTVRLGSRRANVRTLVPPSVRDLSEQEGTPFRVFVASFAPPVPSAKSADVEVRAASR